MPAEITNSLKSSSVIRAVDPGTYTINLTDLAASSAETVNYASIKRVSWTTNGNITVARNSVNLLTLLGSGDIPFTEFGHTLANNKTSPIIVTITTGGTILLDVTKDVTLNVALMDIGR